jgi:hypothetical protein
VYGKRPAFILLMQKPAKQTAGITLIRDHTPHTRRNYSPAGTIAARPVGLVGGAHHAPRTTTIHIPRRHTQAIEG